jgi:hypothetical protein
VKGVERLDFRANQFDRRAVLVCRIGVRRWPFRRPDTNPINRPVFSGCRADELVPFELGAELRTRLLVGSDWQLKDE